MAYNFQFKTIEYTTWLNELCCLKRHFFNLISIKLGEDLCVIWEPSNLFDSLLFITSPSLSPAETLISSYHYRLQKWVFFSLRVHGEPWQISAFILLWYWSQSFRNLEIIRKKHIWWHERISTRLQSLQNSRAVK